MNLIVNFLMKLVSMARYKYMMFVHNMDVSKHGLVMFVFVDVVLYHREQIMIYLHMYQ